MLFLSLSVILISVQCNADQYYFGNYASPRGYQLPYANSNYQPNGYNQHGQHYQNHVQQNCYTSSGVIGTCQLFRDCPSLQNHYRNAGRLNWFQRYLSDAFFSCGCSYYQNKEMYCCDARYTSTPTFPTRPIAPNGPNFLEGEGNTATGGSCATPNGQTGNCRNIRQCEPIFSTAAARRNDSNFINFIKQSNAACGGQPFAVCCPSQIGNVQQVVSDRGRRFATRGEGCGSPEIRRDGSVFVVGGEAAVRNDYPWMALIGYRGDYGKVEYRCGGTLITSRHILTAAHCIRNNIFTVRLGEHDLKEADAEGRIEVPVASSTPYPQYRRSDGFGDLAIITLQREVEYNKSITPICMPTDSRWAGNLTDFSVSIAGWGRTTETGTPSDILMTVTVRLLDTDVCKDRFERLGHRQAGEILGTAALCAGVLEGGKASCFGDSGGPLMIDDLDEKPTVKYQLGVVSFSPSRGCARANEPGAYTRIVNFLGWIQQQIAI